MITGVAAVMYDMNNPDRVLLGKRAKEEGFGLWVLPGGKLEHAENPDFAVKRETLEEVNARLRDPKQVYFEFLPHCQPAEGGCLMLYYAEFVDASDIRIKAAHEFSDLQWFDAWDLPTEMWQSDRNAIKVANRVQGYL